MEESTGGKNSTNVVVLNTIASVSYKNMVIGESYDTVNDEQPELEDEVIEGLKIEERKSSDYNFPKFILSDKEERKSKNKIMENEL